MTNADEPTTIVADGDVCFILADESTVRVSSASPIFATMLGDKFKEGQSERSACHPKRIDLSDDDPEAMACLCRIVHFRAENNDIVTSRPSPRLESCRNVPYIEDANTAKHITIIPLPTMLVKVTKKEAEFPRNRLSLFSTASDEIYLEL